MKRKPREGIVRFYGWICTVCGDESTETWAHRTWCEIEYLAHLRHDHPDELILHSEFIRRIQESNYDFGE